MAGFFGLFGGKNKKQQPKDAYFLSADDAKTYGDIDYMRTAKTVRRTFVKTIGNPDGGESISTVSSEKASKSGGVPGRAYNNVQPAATSTYNSSFNNSSSASIPSISNTPSASSTSSASSTPSTPSVASTAQPKITNTTSSSKPQNKKNVDTSMDMFRSMAKKIKR